VVEIVLLAVALPMVDEVADKEMDKATDARTTNAHTCKWTIIPLKHMEKGSTLTMTQSLVKQTPPGMTNVLLTTEVSQDTSSPTAFTSNVPGIKTTHSTKEHYPHCLLQQEMVT
jgi:hypothetical protein